MPTTSPPKRKRLPVLRLTLALLSATAACESSRDAQLAALSSPEGPTRAQAISELGKAGDGDNLGDIVAHVGDPDALVRSSVASALGNYDERKASDALGERAADPAEPVQGLAARSLARQKNPRAHSYLMLPYRRDGSAVRAAIVEGLEKSGGSAVEVVRAEAKAFWEQLSASLTKGSAAERAGAAEELGRSGRPEAVERLVPYLGADSRALAQAAALGLGESSAPQAREPLEAMLSEPDPDLQLAALQGLEMLGSTESAPALVRTALKGGQVGRAALEALAKLPGDGARFCAVTLSDEVDLAARAGELARARSTGKPALPTDGGVPEAGASDRVCDEKPLFAKLSRGPAAQAAALAAIAALGGPAPAEPQRIVSLLRSGAPEVRPLAARVAGALHLEAAVPDLRTALDEAKGRLQIGRQRWVTDPLPMRFSPGYEPKGAIGGQYKEHEEQLMAKLAAQGAHVDETGVGPVGPLFSDDTADDAALFAEAAVAAIALGATDAADLERGLAQDPSPLVRQAACRAATSLPPSAGWTVLKGLGGDPDPAVRSKALELLPEVLNEAGATPGRQPSSGPRPPARQPARAANSPRRQRRPPCSIACARRLRPGSPRSSGRWGSSRPLKRPPRFVRSFFR